MSDRELLSDLLANGELKADVVIKSGRLVNVHSREIYEADVATFGKRIALVGKGVDQCVADKTAVVNAKGSYLVPGLIDVHYHTAGTYLTITSLAKALLPRGTTAIASDFYEYGAVGGVEAIKFGLAEGQTTPLKILFNVPLLAYIQNNPFGNTNKVRPQDLYDMVDWDSTVAMCEAQAQTAADPAVRELIRRVLKARKTLVGHYIGVDGAALASYLALGPSSDHESIDALEAAEKVRAGIRIAVREGSAAADLSNVIRAITEYRLDPRRFMFCTDEVDAADLQRFGHLDYKIRKAVGMGLDPISAIQMATINAAEYFRVDSDLGSITPGRIADIVIVDDISNFNARMVIADGKVVAENGQFVQKLEAPTYPDFMRKTIKLAKKMMAEDFHVTTKTKAQKAKVHVIIAQEGLLISDRRTAVLDVRARVVMPHWEADILKVAVVERHGAGLIGKGFMSGFGLKSGVIAESFAPVPENIIAVGGSDEDIALAVNRIKEIDGGFVVANKGRIIAEMRLPILGLLSEKPLDDVVQEMTALVDATRTLGCKMKSPFLSLMFMAYPLIPTLKITELGLVDYDKMQLTDVIVEELQ
jgi:adenine deaminase